MASLSSGRRDTDGHVTSEYYYECSYERPVGRRGRRAAGARKAPTAASGVHQNEASPNGLGHDGDSEDHQPGDDYTQTSPFSQTSRWAPERLTGGAPQSHANGVATGLSPPDYRGHANQWSEAVQSPAVPVNGAHRYLCLLPLQGQLEDFLDISSANALLDHYFVQPNISIFHAACPYVLDPVVRKASLQRERRPRSMSPLLTTAILWVCAQTACIQPLLVPRHRSYVCKRLQTLLLSHMDLDTPGSNGKQILNE